MKNIILLLILITTVNLMANPFNNMRVNLYQAKKQVSTKVMYAKRAAIKGDARAQFDLALMYAQGDGVERNERLAFKYFHKAARKNHIGAKFYMGLSFLQGKGVKKQFQLARYWFKLASKSGHLKAMAHLASIEKKFRPEYRAGLRVAFNNFR